MNSLRDSILIGVAMIGFVMGNCPLAQATPSQTGPNISEMMRDSSVWTWPVGKAAPSKAANDVREVWTWPVSKEARVLCGPKLETPSPSLEAKYGIKVKLPSGELLRVKAFSSAVSDECPAGELVGTS